MEKITTYYKPCLSCTFDDWYLVQNWAKNNGFKLRERRTEYNPLWHRMASEIWGSEMYPPFITNDKKSITIEDAIGMIKNKEEDDLLNVFRAKNTNRKTRKMVAKKKNIKKDKEK